MKRLLIFIVLLSYINAAAQSNKTTIPAKASCDTLLDMAGLEAKLIHNCTNPNINGISARIDYYNIKTYEEWGETKRQQKWFKTELVKKGLPVCTIEWVDNDGHYHFPAGYSYTLCIYLHNAEGLLNEVRYYRHHYKYSSIEPPVLPDVFSLERRELYDYDSNSRVKSITFFDYAHYDKEYLVDDFHIYQKDYCFGQRRRVYKIVYKYSSDGNYDVFGCGQNGATMFHNKVDNDKHLVTGKNEVFDIYYTWSFNDRGQLLAYGNDHFATNGVVRFGTYYKYNNNGDMVVKSSRSDVITENAPWLVEKYQDGLSQFYKYSYDSHNNWILQEELGLKNGDMVVIKTIEREIKYYD